MGQDTDGYKTNATSLPAPAFIDIRGHWAEAAIQEAATIGYINGYPDGTFRPDSPVTRAEAVTFMVKALQRARYLPSIHLSPDMLVESFPDTRDHWAVRQGSLPLAFSTSLVTLEDARADQRFEPDAPATRLEVVIWLARAANPALEERLKIKRERQREGWSQEAQAAVHTGLEQIQWPFRDTVGEGAKAHVLQAVKAELIKGFPDGSFGGNEMITRGQMVAILQRLLQRLQSGATLPAQLPQIDEPVIPGRGRIMEVRLSWPPVTGKSRRDLKGENMEDWPALNRLLMALRTVEKRELPPGVGDFPVAPPHRVTLYIRFADGSEDTVVEAVRCEPTTTGGRRCTPEPDWMLLNGQVVYSPLLWDYCHGQIYMDMPLFLSRAN
ncbi:MAG: S-layer homology domain-containing protein [Moorellaceae bacterium]